MRNFLLGVVIGASGAIWYTQTRGQVDVDRQFGQMQERANAVLNESRRILEETRRELSSALESGRQTIQQRTERGRGASFGESASPSGEMSSSTE
ncbi:MAG TPA: hypothetical protein VKT80_14680 [Chloroflexota bacterium]|nr:hypothetical protein [Chloroflexota bacterium]